MAGRLWGPVEPGRTRTGANVRSVPNVRRLGRQGPRGQFNLKRIGCTRPRQPTLWVPRSTGLNFQLCMRLTV